MRDKLKHKEANKRWYEKNREKANAKSKQWRHANREKALLSNAKARATNRGHMPPVITVDELRVLLAEHDGLCDICKENKATCLDHCHETGVVRGLLCDMCNKGLGHFRDSTVLLDNAKGYLNEKMAGRNENGSAAA